MLDNEKSGLIKYNSILGLKPIFLLFHLPSGEHELPDSFFYTAFHNNVPKYGVAA
jgi:hypothetical protein